MPPAEMPRLRHHNVDDTNRTMQTQALLLALRDHPPTPLTRTRGNTLEIQVAPELHATVTLEDDGTILVQHPQLHNPEPIIQLQDPAKALVHAQSDLPRTQAVNLIRDSLMSLLPPSPPETHPAWDTDRFNIFTTYYDARSWTAHRFLEAAWEGLTHHQLSTRVNHEVLHHLGETTIRKTLHLAGQEADSRDHNAITTNPEAFLEASRRNPNAVLLWFSTPHNTPNAAPRDLTPDTIIQQARSHLLQTPRAQAPDRYDTGPDQLWEAFTRMDPRAVNDCPPIQGRHHRLAHLAARTRQDTHPDTLRVLLRLHQNRSPRRDASSSRDLPLPLLASFRQARHERRHDPQALRDLDLELRLVNACYHLEHHSRYRDFVDLTNMLTTDLAPRLHLDPEPWEEWTLPLPEADLRQARAGTRETAKPQTNRKPRPTNDQVRDILQGEPIRAIAAATGRNVALDHQPGAGARLRSRNQPAHDILVNRSPAGLLLVSDSQTDARNIPLDSRCAPAWVSRGMALHDLLEETKHWLTKNWRKLPQSRDLSQPARGQLALALASLLPTLEPQLLDPVDDEALSRRFHQALLDLADPDALRLAHWLHTAPTVHDHNIGVLLGGPGAQLAATNPGALRWVATFQPPDQPVNHPGQTITRARQHLLHHGLNPDAWKFVAAANPHRMSPLLDDANPHTAVRLLNTAARADHLPDRDAVEFALRTYEAEKTFRMAPAPQEDTGGHTLIRQNNDTLLALLFRHLGNPPGGTPADAGRTLDDAQQAADYTRHLAGRDLPLRSKTWRGLLRAQDAWHREISHQVVHDSWTRGLKSHRNRCRTWESALPETTIQDIDFVPLCDEQELHRESLHLKHCVYQYGPDCAAGTSRIFSARRGGRRLATIELAPRTHRWLPSQVRAHHNQQPPPEVWEASRLLARLYTRAVAQQPHRDPGWMKVQHAAL